MTPWTRVLTASCLAGTALAYGCSGDAFLGSGSDAGTSGSSSGAGGGSSGAAASGSAETSGNASGTVSGAMGSGATSGSPTSSSGSNGGSGTAAGSGAGSGSSPSSGSGASSGASSSGSTADAGKPCTTSADCADPQLADVGFLCGFPEADGCAAKGTCFQEPGGAMCAAFLPGCACNGSDVNLTCNGLPGGYAPAPLLHNGICLGPGPVVLPDAGSGEAGK